MGIWTGKKGRGKEMPALGHAAWREVEETDDSTCCKSLLSLLLGRVKSVINQSALNQSWEHRAPSGLPGLFITFNFA